MHEQAVAITDFVLAMECAVFSFLIAPKLPKGSYRMWLLVFFVSIAAGALFGGITHAYFPSDTPAGRALWIATMLAVGVTAATCWILGAEVIQRRWYPLRIAAAISLLAYTGVLMHGWRSYQVVVRYYLPAAIFLLMCAVEAAWKGHRNHWWTAMGLVLTFVAAAVQGSQVEFAILDHNALYHLVQAVALLLVYIGFVRVSAVQGP